MGFGENLERLVGHRRPVRRGARDLHRRHQCSADPAGAGRRRAVLSRRQLANALLHAFAQHDIAVIGETPTAGYNLLKAEISYTKKLKPAELLAKEITVGIVGNNLLRIDCLTACDK
jgi:precorrin isomerase